MVFVILTLTCFTLLALLSGHALLTGTINADLQFFKPFDSALCLNCSHFVLIFLDSKHKEHHLCLKNPHQFCNELLRF